MRDKHITEVLDNTAFASLSRSDLAEIRTHAEGCEPCRSSFAAAQLSSVETSERAQVAVEPSPFFQTRVMAAWREHQAIERVPAFWRLWKSTRAVVSSMALTTAALGVLSFVFSAPASNTLDQTASVYSAESVIFDQGGDDQLTYEQVLNAIYADDQEK